MGAICRNKNFPFGTNFYPKKPKRPRGVQEHWACAEEPKFLGMCSEDMKKENRGPKTPSRPSSFLWGCFYALKFTPIIDLYLIFQEINSDFDRIPPFLRNLGKIGTSL